MDAASLRAILLTLLAGLATGLGGLVVVFIKKSSDRFLSASLGFAAGIVLAISLMDMIPESVEMFIEDWGRGPGILAAFAAVALGMAVGKVIDRFIPHHHHSHSHGGDPCDKEGCVHEEHCPHELHDGRDAGACEDSYRLGLITALAMVVHNLPEGAVAFMVGYADFAMGVSMALAIALHNIPVGMAISLPIYHSGESRLKAVGAATAAGMAAPLGAVLSYWLLRPYLSSLLLAGLFGFVAGFMLYLAFDELIPSSRSHGYGRLSMYSTMVGIALMTVAIFATGHHHVH